MAMIMKHKLCIALAVAFSCGACGDFLDLAPPSERNVQDFYNTAADFNNAAVGAYAALKLAGLYGNSIIWMGEVATDNTDYGVTRNPVNVDNFQFIDFNYGSLNGVVYAAWRDAYNGISRANHILERIEKSNIPDAQKQQYTGEAQFLRAFYYFYLVRLFGDVPLVTNPVNSPNEGANLTRASAEQVYQFIISDLRSALGLLPETYNNANRGRATRFAAQTLLAKVYLTRKEFPAAVAELEAVINSGRYRLLDDYGRVFAFDNPHNAEIIFDVQYISGQVGQGSNLWERFAPWQSGVAVLGPNGGNGGGINRPTQDLINAYEEGDLRKEASIRTSYVNAQGTEVQEPYVVKYRQFGMLPGDGDSDFPVLRFADVLLMLAEALNEQGRTGEAAPLINQVRERAGLEGLTGLSQSEMRLAIEQERRVEFAFESQRWFDLVRTGRYQEVMNDKGYPVMPHHNFFIIPQREIDLNPAIKQNPGY
jgi:tetratricopeptide (TPR) repeat protein